METIDSAEKSFVARRRITGRKPAARAATMGNIKASRAKENTGLKGRHDADDTVETAFRLSLLCEQHFFLITKSESPPFNV